jgi:hypothetical protein
MSRVLGWIIAATLAGLPYGASAQETRMAKLGNKTVTAVTRPPGRTAGISRQQMLEGLRSAVPTTPTLPESGGDRE